MHLNRETENLASVTILLHNTSVISVLSVISVVKLPRLGTTDGPSFSSRSATEPAPRMAGKPRFESSSLNEMNERMIDTVVTRLVPAPDVHHREHRVHREFRT